MLTTWLEGIMYMWLICSNMMLHTHDHSVKLNSTVLSCLIPYNDVNSLCIYLLDRQNFNPVMVYSK